MDEYAVDVAPAEMLAWIREDERRTSPRLSVRASKDYAQDPADRGAVASAGEDEEVRPLILSGLLEVSPKRRDSGWTLALIAEESVALRAAGEDEGYLDETDMTVDAFEADFLSPERGRVEVMVRAEDAAAWRRFRRWLAARRQGRT